MLHPTSYNAAEAIKKTHELQETILKKEKELDELHFQWQQMKKENAANIVIQLKESILYCMQVDKDFPQFGTYFLKTPSFLSDCIAWNHGIDATRVLKNKVASTLSFMYSKKEIGRYEHSNGKTYYGLPKYFKKDLKSVKDEYAQHTHSLAA